MRKLILAACAVSLVMGVPLATIAKAEHTTVIKKDYPDGDSKTVIKKDTPFGEKKTIIKKEYE
jgi:hypothetical protein